jgi:transcriptional regulator with GAF, ATPase, and Fis domain/tetratricopeptide (TPR) repeat protein/predicted Ser/Thr protein kinase
MRPILGRYEVVRQLGEGGGGAVYLVRDRFAGGRGVALKRIHDARDEILGGTLRREFQVLAALRHASLAEVYDFGEIGPGEDVPPGLFFTREHIEGAPLVEALADASAERVARVFVELARALEPLHRSGLLHGDLKPHNVIVGDDDRVRLIDFGLARRQDAGQASGLGTISYLAPEIAQGLPADVRSDLYALGATLYQALTGRPPFTGESVREVIDQHLRAMPPEPVAGRPALAGAIFDKLAQVALRCLAKKPSDRYPDVSEVEAAIRSACPDAAARAEPFIPVLPGTIGREGELDTLEGALAKRIDRAASSPLHVVQGEAGSGKSTLLREFRWRAQLRGVRVVEVPVAAAGGTLAAAGTLLARTAALLPDDDPLHDKARDALASLENATGGDEAQDAGVLRDAIARVVLAASARAPLCIVVEDLDLADADVGALLRYVAHSAATEDRLLLVASHAVDAESVRALGPAPRAVLRPLGAPEVAALVKAARGRSDDALAAAVLQHAGGNPLFTMEVLRAALAGGVATERDLEALRLPARLEDMLLQRVRTRPEDERAVLLALAAVGRPATTELIAAGAGQTSAGQELARLRAAGIVSRTTDGTWALARAQLGPALLAGEPAASRRLVHGRIAHALAASGLERPELAHHLVQAGDRDGARRAAPTAAAALRKIGAYRQAAQLLEGLATLLEGEPAAREALETLVELAVDIGDYDRAEALVARLLRDAEGGARAHALALRGRVAVERGALEIACQALEQALALETAPGAQAEIIHRLARAHLRRGDFPAAEDAARRGLALAPPEGRTRVDLTAVLGLVAMYRGDLRGGTGTLQEALELARAGGERRSEMTLLSYLATARKRAGDFSRAADYLRQSLAIAEEVGDAAGVASYHATLGAICYEMGEPARALDHYQQAVRIAGRVGRDQTAVVARNNLANLYTYLGLYERAQREAEEALADAERLGLKAAAAHGAALLGDVAARQGRRDDALRHYADATERYRGLGQTREIAELALEEADVRLDRGMPGDFDAAFGILQTLARTIEAEGLDDFRARHSLLLGRALALRGDEDAAAELDRALKLASGADQRDLEWQVHAIAAELFADRGADFLARRRTEQALEILEQIAASLPKEFRHSFWQDPRRRAAQRRVAQASGEWAVRPPIAASTADDALGLARTAPLPGAAPGGPEGSEKLYRLLELNKKINSELDLDRLLETIMDTVVELSGAERGFLLLADEHGSLQRTTVRDVGGATPTEDHAQFSRSIAEAVFVDGEPVITTSALDDDRFNEYLSVHQLRLQSVLCLPIRARGRVLGVLYLENRVRHGRFGEGDQHLLALLADQVAIAIENARLIREAQQKSEELERANHELEAAKQQIEEHLNRRTAQLEAARSELRRARSELREKFGYRGIVGRSETMRRLFAVLDRVRETDVPVVIHGESGTGKEMVARAIHYAGPRAKKPFVAINCAAIPETILESELFGHVRGSFTGADRDKRGLFQSADGGTLFLDEIGDMPQKMQLDLLRVLQEKRVRPVGGDKDIEVDVRVLAASNKMLRDLIAEGKFREDLYYRLNVVEMVLPPLRDRIDDIPLLVDHFLTHIAARFKAEKKGITREAVKRLMAYPWPGNVRQLDHALMNAWVLSDSETLDEGDFSLEPLREPLSQTAVAGGRPSSAATVPPPERVDRRAMEKQRILEALERTNWNKSKACAVLGMPRRTLYRRLREYEIQ